MLYAGLVVGFCVLLAVAGCGSIAGNGSLEAAQTGVNFGAVVVGQASTQTLSFMNGGTGAVQIASVNVTGASFKLAGSGSFPVNVAAGAAYSVQVEFSPASAGSATGQATVMSNATSGLPTVSLTGLGVQPAPAPPPPVTTAALNGISCGKASITGSGTDSCNVTLSAAAPTGGLVVALVSASAAVTVPASVRVPSGAFGAQFVATATAVTTPQTATLTASADGVSQSFGLQLNAAGAYLSASQTSIVFGDVSLNVLGSQTLTLTSTGTLPVTVNAAVVTGTGFTMASAGLPITLNPGQSLKAVLEFLPIVQGSVTGQLTITSTATMGGTMIFPMTGTGATPYQVDLSWDPPASSSDAVAGYHVYRVLGSGSVYQLLNPAVNATTTFTDSSVTNGQSYVYYVTSVDSSGGESIPSNIFAVTIP
jgi:hypothetical protein